MKNNSTSITFQNEDVSFVLKQKTKIRKWILDAIQSEGYQLNELNYNFCSDEFLYQMNVNYLNHNTYTDIITFDHSHNVGHILGDIFISIDRVKENAKELQLSQFSELLRVMIHGVLHLCSYQDHLPEEKAQMRLKEDEYLSLFDI